MVTRLLLDRQEIETLYEIARFYMGDTHVTDVETYKAEDLVQEVDAAVEESRQLAIEEAALGPHIDLQVSCRQMELIIHGLKALTSLIEYDPCNDKEISCSLQEVKDLLVDLGEEEDEDMSSL